MSAPTAAPMRAAGRPQSPAVDDGRPANTSMSVVQRRLWLAERIFGPGVLDNLALVLGFEGELDPAALGASLSAVVSRHPALRTRFRTRHDGPFAVVDPPGAVALAAESCDPVELGSVCRAERSRAFDLARDAPCRFRLLRDGRSGRHVLLITIHEVAADRVSLDVLFNDLITAYRALAAGRPSPLAPLSLEYGDFAAGQAGALAASSVERQLDYWRACLADLPPVMKLPTDRPRPAVQGFRSSRQRVVLSAPLSARIRELSEGSGVTVFATLWSAFVALLGRYCGEHDLAVGTPVAGRSDMTEHLIGRFENVLVLRGDLSDDPSFVDLLQTSQNTLREARAHQDVPFEHVVQALQPQRSLSHAPLFQVLFALDEAPAPRAELPALVVAPMAPQWPPAGRGARCDLCLNLADSREGIAGFMVYNAELFERATIVRMLGHFEQLLRAAVAAPRARISSIELLSEAEQRRQLVEWNDTGRSFSGRRAVHDSFEQQAQRTPERIALIHADGVMTYRELNERASGLADRLSAAGVAAGALVGLCVNRCPETVVGILGILKTGAAYVPIDPRYPRERIRFMLEDSGVAVVVGQSRVAPQLSGFAVELVRLEERGQSVVFTPMAPRRGAVKVSASSPACLLYTSGSTGRPKGVLIAHRSILNRVNWMTRVLPAAADEVFCFRTSISFIDHVAEVFQPLAQGMPIAIAPDHGPQSSAALIDHLSAFGVTRITLVPSLLRELLDRGQTAKLSALKFVFSSGDVLTFGLVKRFFERLPNCRLFNVYGSTEVGADVSSYEVTYVDYLDIERYFHAEPQTGLSAASPQSTVPARAEITRPNISLDELKDRFSDATVPEHPMRLEAYMDDLGENVFPYLVNVSSEVFVGHMTSALPSFIADLSKIIARTNQNMVKIETSKALTLLERQVLAMMHRMFFARDDYDSIIQDPHHVLGIATGGGSTANITALWCARNSGLMKHGVSKRELTDEGAIAVTRRLGYSGSVIIASRLAHYSVKKAAALLGLGERDILVIDQDDDQRLSLSGLRACIEHCRERNQYIIALIGIAGATETGTIDPLEDMAEAAREHGIHFHVDAAWGGAFIFSDRHRYKLSGIERADSVTICPHKQLYVSQGLSLCLFRDSTLAHAMSVHAEYQAKSGSFDMGQYTLEGSRPAVSVLLHAVLYLISRRGFAWLIDRSMENADYFRRLVTDGDAFELVGVPEINILNYRYIPRRLRSGRRRGRYSAAQNREISAAVDFIQRRQFLEGKTFVSRTRILNRVHCPEPISVFRVVLSNPLTSRGDLRRVVQDQLRIAEDHLETDRIDIAGHDEPWVAAGDRTEEIENMAVPIGKPIDNVKLYVLDRRGAPVPIGVIGEICVAGDALASCYFNNPSLTAEKFCDNPFEAGKRLFRSGDRGRLLPDGNIEFLGRTDHQEKVGGYRIELGEIESQLTTVEGVSECAVATRDDRGSKTLVAYVVGDASTQETDPDAFKKGLRRRLCALVPAHLVPEEFVLLRALPVTPNGKLDRKLLPESSEQGPQAPGAQPQGTTERYLASIWREILGVEDLDRDASFFALGGDSWDAYRVIARIRRDLALDLPLRTLFEAPELPEFAERLDMCRTIDTVSGRIPPGHGDRLPTTV